MTESLESLFIEVPQYDKNSKHVVIGVLYKPPGCKFSDFLETFESILQCINNEHKPCLLLGDFNVNLLSLDISNNVKGFYDTLVSYNMLPLIQIPTRITRNTATLIDNIFCNIDGACTQGVLIADFSDHLPVFVSTNINLNSSTPAENTPKYISKRVINDCNIARFCQYLNEINFELGVYSADVNKAYEVFMDKINNAYNKSFPMKTVKMKKENKNPWFTSEIKKMSKKKLKLYKKFLGSPTTDNHKRYKQFRNQFTKTVRKAKRRYYKDAFKDVSGNMTATWKIVNSLLGKRRSKNVNFEKDNQTLSEIDVAENFNEYFINVAPKLLDEKFKDAPSSKSYSCNVPYNPKSLFCKPITECEISDIVKNMKNNTSCGYDDINVKVIKKSIPLLCKPLCIVFNISLQTGTFPDLMKRARVTPIRKSGQLNSVKNYRPISA